MRGCWIGVIDGGVIWQIVGGQIGGISIELLHSACICPFTHRHTQAPNKSEAGSSHKVRVATMPNRNAQGISKKLEFMLPPNKDNQISGPLPLASNASPLKRSASIQV